MINLKLTLVYGEMYSLKSPHPPTHTHTHKYLVSLAPSVENTFFSNQSAWEILTKSIHHMYKYISVLYSAL